jgi:hypothetical protein
MLRFQTPLTAAAREIIVFCLEVASDEIIDVYEDHEVWAAAYPLSSACFTRELARGVLLELLEKLDAPEWYMPTDYHWLLVYECLKEQITLFNDGPVPSVVKRLRTLASDQDTPYVYLPKRSRGTVGVWIDFDKVIDVYFWDTDFLPPDAKQQFRFRGGIWGDSWTCPAPGRAYLKAMAGGWDRQNKGPEQSW